MNTLARSTLVALAAGAFSFVAPVARSQTPPAKPPPAAPFVKKPLRITTVTLSEADKTAVQRAFDAAIKQFEKDGDRQKLAAAGSTLSRDASRAYGLRVSMRLGGRDRATTQLSTLYVLESATVVGYESGNELSCDPRFTIDFVVKNQGAPPAGDTEARDFMFWNESLPRSPGTQGYGERHAVPRLVMGASATIRETLKFELLTRRGEAPIGTGRMICDLISTQETRELGTIGFSIPLGRVGYHASVENGTFTLTRYL